MWATSNRGSAAVVPFACGTPDSIVAVISVAALPMSICPQAMLYRRPSSAVDFVSPVIACWSRCKARNAAAAHAPKSIVVDGNAAALRLLFFHQSKRLPRAQERARHVHIDDGSPLVDRHIFQRSAA